MCADLKYGTFYFSLKNSTLNLQAQFPSKLQGMLCYMTILFLSLFVSDVSQVKERTPSLYMENECKRPAEQRLHWERKEKRIPGQSITSPIVKSLSEASFGLMGQGEVK